MMNTRQRFLKTVYPAYVLLSRLSEKKSRVLCNATILPPVSFYAHVEELCDGTLLDFRLFKGKKVLLVNTASGCGYTEQYDQMQRLFRQYHDKLMVIAFPTNDFGEEKTDDEEIAIYCKEHYRVSFPLIKKSVVIKTRFQNTTFQWLTDPTDNGWNSQQPTWNFCKYLVDENGTLINYFGSAIEPMGKEILRAIDA